MIFRFPFHYLLRTPGRRFAAAAIALTLLRIASLVAGHPDLGPDEGQYWFWSQHPAFGYFSKPPVIAWSIAATTALFGDAEWAVRLSAPLYQAGAAAFLFALTRRLANPRAAFYAGLVWLTLPGVFLSAALITTDAPLLFFWSAALYAFFRLTDERAANGKICDAVLLGAAIGLGLLSKYAMLYFALGALLVLALRPQRRANAGARNLFIALVLALAIFAPNLAWNAAHDFQTVQHTAANAEWNGDFFHWDQLGEFLFGQIGVAGPIMIVIILAALFSKRRDTRDRGLVDLVIIAAPALAIVTAQSFISRAHANWAAGAYPSLIVFAAIFAASAPFWLKAMRASLALHLILGGGFLSAFVNAGFASAVGAGPAFKRLEGWREQGAAIAQASRDFDVIMTDDREITGELVYYARAGKPIVAWNNNRRVDNHFEAFYPFDPQLGGRTLYVTAHPDGLYARDGFARMEPVGAVSARMMKGRTRTLYLFEASEPRTP